MLQFSLGKAIVAFMRRQMLAALLLDKAEQAFAKIRATVMTRPEPAVRNLVPPLWACGRDDSRAVRFESRMFAVYGPGRPAAATVKRNVRITAEDHFQETRHMAFDWGPDGPSYQPGDILTIWPRQDPAAVAQILRIFGLKANDKITIENAAQSSPTGVHQTPRPSMEVDERLWSFLPSALLTQVYFTCPLWSHPQKASSLAAAKISTI